MIRVVLGLFLMFAAAGTADLSPLTPATILLAVCGALLLAAGRHAFKDTI